VPTKISGLPAHVLLIHAVVVLVPLAALMTIASAIWPAARRRFGIGTPLVALVALVLVPITTSAGEWLRDHVAPSKLVREHAELGDQLLPFALGTFVLAAVVWWLGRQADDDLPRHSILRRAVVPTGWLRPSSLVAAALAVVVSVGAVVQVYRIGESGARAAWHDGFSSTSTHGG
jgi:hypothetical protein